MTNYLYARLDKFEGVYSPPFAAANDDVACRSFLYLFGIPGKVEKTTYALYRLAIFNNETGAVEASDPVDLTPLLEHFLDRLNQTPDKEVTSDGTS